MLQTFREKFTGWVAIAILGLIGVTFVFVGGANFAFVGNNYAAKVDGVEIGAGSFEDAYRRQLEQNPQLAQLPGEFRQQVRESILEGLVQQQLIDNYLKDAGFQISDQTVTDLIQMQPDFQVGGKFDREVYKTLLFQNGLKPKQFEEQQRRSLRRSQLQRAIGATAIVTPAEYRRYLNLAAEQRVVRLATFNADEIADSIEVSEQQVTDFYDNNATLYQLPETADVEYIEIRRDDVAEGIEISEAALAEYYEFEKDRYLQDEQRRARHILIQFGDDEAAAEALARELLARVQGGESFADVAAEASMDGGTAASGGDLGIRTKTQLPEVLGDAIFAMTSGEIDGPVKSDFGFHVVQLDEILAQGPRPLDEVRGELLAEMRSNEANGLFLELERKVSDALFDAKSMQEIAASAGLSVQSASGFSRSGGEPFGGNQVAIDTVFEDSVLTGGRISDIVELDANRSAVFRVVNYQQAMRQSLEDVREQVVEAVKADAANRIMIDKAEQMLQGVAEGTQFAAAAEAAGAVASEAQLIARNAQNVDQSVAFAVFTAGKPEQGKPLVGRTQNSAGGHTVYSIEAVLAGRPESIPVADRDAGKAQLAQESGMADYIAFVTSLRESAEVIVNEDIVAAQDLL